MRSENEGKERKFAFSPLHICAVARAFVVVKESNPHIVHTVRILIRSVKKEAAVAQIMPRGKSVVQHNGALLL